MLKKRISWRMYRGTALICVGTVAAVLHSSKAELCATANDLIRNYTHNFPYQIFLAFTAIFAIVLHLVYCAYRRSVDRGSPLPHAQTVLPVTYAAFSAIFGTQSVVQAKCLAELLQGAMPTIYPVFLSWFTYFALFAWILLVAVWLYRMNQALGLYDPIFIIPLLQVDFILFAIVAGGIYFREFDDFTPRMWIGFTCGIALVFVGLFMLAPTEQRNAEKIAPAGVEEQQLRVTSDEDSYSLRVSAPKDSNVCPPQTPAQARIEIEEPVVVARSPFHDTTLNLEETPRSQSHPGRTTTTKTRPSSSTPHQISALSYVTSISAQFNKNDLDQWRPSRGSSTSGTPIAPSRRKSSDAALGRVGRFELRESSWVRRHVSENGERPDLPLENWDRDNAKKFAIDETAEFRGAEQSADPRSPTSLLERHADTDTCLRTI